jgi:hypothetical protein
MGAYIDIEIIIDLDSLAKYIDPLAKVCELPHVAQSMKDRRRLWDMLFLQLV